MFDPASTLGHAPATAPVTATRGFRALIEALRRRFEQAQQEAARRASLRALARLEPHHLADIGVTRADVQRELRASRVSI